VEGIQIIKIPSKFVEYLSRRYSDLLKTIPSEAKWVASLPNNANTSGASNRTTIFSIIFQEHDRANNLLVDLITALRLHQKGRVVAGLLTSAKFENAEWSIEGETIWTPVSSVDFFEEEPEYTFHQQDVFEVNNLLHSIRQWREAGILDRIDIALKRFHSSYHYPIEYRIVDQMIALESLYIGDDKELGYKLRLRSAFLLGKDRARIFKDLKKAYDFRGQIVHGNNPPNRDKLRVIVPKTEEYLRQSIRKFLSLLSLSQGHTLKSLRQGTNMELAELDENILNNGALLD